MTTLRLIRRHSRLIWGVVAVIAIVAVAGLAIARGDGWIALFFALMPDIGLLYGVSPALLARGQLLPRAVPLYNILHSLGWAQGLRPF